MELDPSGVFDAEDDSYKDPVLLLQKHLGEMKTPVGKRILEPPFCGVPTFFRAPYMEKPEDIEIALIGLPFDQGLTNRPGARYGPRAIREASLITGLFNHQTGIAPLAITSIADLGDVAISNCYDLKKAIRELEDYYISIKNAGIVPITAGGDHSVTYPILKALGRDEPLGLVHFDAHCDTGPEYKGSKFHHGGPFRNAVEEGVLDPKRTIQIGIRGKGEILWDFSYSSGMKVVHIEEFYEMGMEALTCEIKNIVGDGPVYISVDIDCLDPAFAPGTGTPECGGMSTFELQQVLRSLEDLNVVGADIVEVSPPYDPAGITALAGASIMFELLCLASASVAWKRKLKE